MGAWRRNRWLGDDELMTGNRPPETLVANWWKYHRLTNGARAERKSVESGEASDAVRANQMVMDVVGVGGAKAVEWLDVLNEAAPPGDDGVTVGCGPLEDLINAQADLVIDEIERRARQSPAFARALSRVWPAWSAMAKVTEDRLVVWIDRNK